MKRPKIVKIRRKNSWHDKQLDRVAKKFQKDFDKMFEDELLFHLSRTPSQRIQDSEIYMKQIFPS